MANFVKFQTAVNRPDVPNTEGRSCTDVLNLENSCERWANVLDEFAVETAQPLPVDDDNRGKLAIKAILDVSSSMDGNKLTAVKLGLCAVVAHLADTDRISISCFASGTSQLTDGFQLVSSLRATLPEVLYKLRADGCTACYDATLAGIAQLKQYAVQQNSCSTDATSTSSSSAEASSDQSAANEPIVAPAPSVDDDKNIVIVLTDGADNASRSNTLAVYETLREPGMDAFMFILVAVEMNRRDERSFRHWLELSHCKQVSVQVRTGTMLVRVFKEILMSRVLQTAVTSNRFYYRSIGPVVRLEVTERVHVPHTELSARALSEWEEENGDANRRDFERAHSPAISICESCSDHGDDDFDYLVDGSASDSDSDMDTDLDDDDVDGDDVFIPHMGPGPYGHGVPVAATVVAMQQPTPVVVPEGLDLSGIVLPAEFRCPITQALMLDPVVACDGHTYDRAAIEEWLRTPSVTAEASVHTSPLTNLPLENDQLIPNRSLRALIQDLVNSLGGVGSSNNIPGGSSNEDGNDSQEA